MTERETHFQRAEKIAPYKRFMVFEDNDYESQGGLGDCRQSFDNIDEALTYIKTSTYDQVVIFDRVEGITI